jgi:hypothetical protein
MSPRGQSSVAAATTGPPASPGVTEQSGAVTAIAASGAPEPSWSAAISSSAWTLTAVRVPALTTSTV